MKRTRKWTFVAQEAQRLAGLGLSPVEIATRLDVRRETVQRWMAAGKLPDTRRGARAARAATVTGKAATPAAWAKAVRAAFALDATDEQIVGLAESALLLARDPAAATAERLSAMGRFQALVKQLALVARLADEKPEPMVKKAAPARAVARRPVVDTRNILTAVK